MLCLFDRETPYEALGGIPLLSSYFDEKKNSAFGLDARVTLPRACLSVHSFWMRRRHSGVVSSIPRDCERCSARSSLLANIAGLVVVVYMGEIRVDVACLELRTIANP
jgi:hypothetical protein